MNGCTRNCLQGRMCDCVPDVEIPEPRVSPVFSTLYAAVAAVFGCALIVHATAELWPIAKVLIAEAQVEMSQ